MNTSTDTNHHLWVHIIGGTQNISTYSQDQLPCNGRACAQCGKCRDWYWTVQSPYWFGNYKGYIKRADATCTGCFGGSYDNRYDYDCCFGGGSYYHWFWACCCFGRHCECDDNRA